MFARNHLVAGAAVVLPPLLTQGRQTQRSLAHVGVGVLGVLAIAIL